MDHPPRADIPTSVEDGVSDGLELCGSPPQSEKGQKQLAHPMLQQATGPECLVDFDGPNDPYKPWNWPLRKKAYMTALWALTTCWITFASAVYASGTSQISQEFQVSAETANVGTALLVFGFALGPLLWAPLCELHGRKWAAIAVSTPVHPSRCLD